ncbi:MAG TPA: 50S ribosomal protein L15 [Dehalococcoidia bacterium]|nr:50S ribosomal protein L15 [Dehalococcoidia bacterium]
MQAHDLRPPKGAKHARRRVGRGNASGHGTYSSKGLKGQKARSGKPLRAGFEGGQTPLVKRLPKRRGFRNRNRVEYRGVNLKDLAGFAAGTEVTPELLKERNIIAGVKQPVKVLGDGQLAAALTVRAHKFSATARAAIEAAGGQAIEITGTSESNDDNG